MAQNLARGLTLSLAPLLLGASVVRAEPALESVPKPSAPDGLEGEPWFEPLEDPIAWMEVIPDEPFDEEVSTDWLCRPGCEELWTDLPLEDSWVWAFDDSWSSTEVYASLPPTAVMRGLGMADPVVATPGPLPVIGVLTGWQAARRLRRRTRAARG